MLSDKFEESEHSCYNPEDILKGIDSTLKKVLLDWQAFVRTTATSYYTQVELRDKYSRLEQDAELFNTFKSEAKRQWQWPKQYKAIAQPVPSSEEPLQSQQHPLDGVEAVATQIANDVDMIYDIDLDETTTRPVLSKVHNSSSESMS